MNLTLIEDQNIKNKDYTIQPLPKAEYSECTFSNCNFENSDMSHIIFLECDFFDCNFSNVNIMHTSFNDVNFKSCKILGVLFQNCNPFLLSFTFTDCILNLSSLYQVNINRTKFLNCIMHQVDFTEAEAKYVTFKDCDLSQSIFYQTNLEHTDFSTAYNFSINPLNNNIKRSTYSTQNVSGLLDTFNIKIND